MSSGAVTAVFSAARSCISDAERKSLYALFLESVQARLRRREDTPTDTVTEQQATKRSLIKMQSIVAQHMQMDDVHDPLLAINFARLAAAQQRSHCGGGGGGAGQLSSE